MKPTKEMFDKVMASLDDDENMNELEPEALGKALAQSKEARTIATMFGPSAVIVGIRIGYELAQVAAETTTSSPEKAIS